MTQEACDREKQSKKKAEINCLWTFKRFGRLL